MKTSKSLNYSYNEMFQTKVAEKIETHFMFDNFFFFPPENLAVNEMMWKNTVQPDMPLMRMLG